MQYGIGDLCLDYIVIYRETGLSVSDIMPLVLGTYFTRSFCILSNIPGVKDVMLFLLSVLKTEEKIIEK